LNAIDRIKAGGRADDLESPTLDFKEDRSGGTDVERSVAEAAICFANSAGGVVVVGVSDRVSGPEAFTGTRTAPERLRQRVFDLTRPHMTVEVERHPEFPAVLLVLVPQSPELHSDPQGRATERINTACVPMTPDRQMRLREERRGVDWSAEPSTVAATEVSADALAAARKAMHAAGGERRKIAKASDMDLLTAVGAGARRGPLNRAGRLAFAGPARGERHWVLYQYRDTPGGEPVFVERLEAPLVTAFFRLLELIGARQRTIPITLPTGVQVTIEDFPMSAVREAVSNALCHRDYHLKGPVVVDHSPQVLSVTSPGPLVAGVTVSNILTTTSRPRNAALTNVFRGLGLAEELGSGVDRMYRAMLGSGRDAPLIEGEFDRVKVTFVGAAPNANIVRFVSQLPPREQDDTDTMIVLARLCRHRTVTASTVSPLLQKSAEETDAILRRLASDDVALLETTRGTAARLQSNYRLRSDALRRLGSAVEYNRRTTDDIDRKVVAHVTEYGKITNRTLQNFFDVGVYKARDILSDLVSRGILTRISTQTRGPKVEWGPGPDFPRAGRRSKRRGDDPTGTID
jgi:ATP-dependent DNA helicase RecG